MGGLSPHIAGCGAIVSGAGVYTLVVDAAACWYPRAKIWRPLVSGPQRSKNWCLPDGAEIQGPWVPGMVTCLLMCEVGPRASDGPLVGGAPGPQEYSGYCQCPGWVALSLGPSGA